MTHVIENKAWIVGLAAGIFNSSLAPFFTSLAPFFYFFNGVFWCSPAMGSSTGIVNWGNGGTAA
jgi:hypothetical protein